MTPAAAPLPPIAVIETGLFLLAFPILLLMFVWAVVTAFRILVPEAPPPLDPAARHRRRGEPAPVRLRQIVDEQRRRPVAALPKAETEAGADGRVVASGPLADALWARRN